MAHPIRRVAILLFDGVEVLDFAGPFEVFSVANEGGETYFEVYTVSQGGSTVTTTGGLRVQPHYDLTSCPTPDIILVPGGDGRRVQMHNPVVLAWLQQHASQLELLLSVCTGAFILGQAGLLHGCRATTYYQRFDEFATCFPDVPLVRDAQYVDNGRVITSAGISAGIGMSLYVVQRLVGQGRATAQRMEYLPYLQAQ